MKRRQFSLFCCLLLAGFFFMTPGSADTDDLLSFTGTVEYLDLEGGFYGITTGDGTGYLPMNLPEKYQIDGLFVTGTGWPDDAITIQMWGQPLRLNEISAGTLRSTDETAWQSGIPDGTVSENATLLPPDRALLAVASGIQLRLDGIDACISEAATELSSEDLRGDRVIDIMTVCAKKTGIAGMAVYDQKGDLITALPVTGTPVPDPGSPPSPSLTSDTVRTRAFFLPADTRTIGALPVLTYPVFSETGCRSGYLSAIIDPVTITREGCEPVLNQSGMGCMVIQPDGFILYDQDPDQIGRNTWDEPGFTESPTIRTIAAAMQQSRAGAGMYLIRSGDGNEHAREITWTSVSLHGLPWRVAIIR